jgi:hypothetical protein
MSVCILLACSGQPCPISDSPPSPKCVCPIACSLFPTHQGNNDISLISLEKTDGDTASYFSTHFLDGENVLAVIKLRPCLCRGKGWDPLWPLAHEASTERPVQCLLLLLCCPTELASYSNPVSQRGISICCFLFLSLASSYFSFIIYSEASQDHPRLCPLSLPSTNYIYYYCCPILDCKLHEELFLQHSAWCIVKAQYMFL